MYFDWIKYDLWSKGPGFESLNYCVASLLLNWNAAEAFLGPFDPLKYTTQITFWTTLISNWFLRYTLRYSRSFYLLRYSDPSYQNIRPILAWMYYFHSLSALIAHFAAKKPKPQITRATCTSFIFQKYFCKSTLVVRWLNYFLLSKQSRYYFSR